MTPEIGGYVLVPPKALPEFELIDGKGRSFRRQDFLGAWSFVYFGYTYCPDVCPLSLLVMADLKRLLTESQPEADTEFYMVSVDPARDTPERIDDYVTYFDPEFRGLTGDLVEIDKLAKAASVVYVIPDAELGESYLVGHSSTITLVNPKGEIQAILTSPLIAENLASDFDKILGDDDGQD